MVTFIRPKNSYGSAHLSTAKSTALSNINFAVASSWLRSMPVAKKPKTSVCRPNKTCVTLHATPSLSLDGSPTFGQPLCAATLELHVNRQTTTLKRENLVFMNRNPPYKAGCCNV